MNNKTIFISAIFAILTGCATLTSDAMTQIMVSFSDGSDGKCTFDNKRGSWSGAVPGTISVRRSDDSLRFSCKTDDGRDAAGSTASEYGAKHLASVVFLDFGITDAITDKHRSYTASLVIPVESKKITKADTTTSSSENSYEKLKNLNELKEQGIITQEEFDSEKKKILGS